MESGLYLLGLLYLLYLLWLYSLSLYLLWQVEEMKSGLASRMGEQEQHAMVARALISVQQEVLEQHGLTQP